MLRARLTLELRPSMSPLNSFAIQHHSLEGLFRKRKMQPDTGQCRTVDGPYIYTNIQIQDPLIEPYQIENANAVSLPLPPAQHLAPTLDLPCLQVTFLSSKRYKIKE